MIVKVYIGTQEFDYSGDFNINLQCYDIDDLSIGSINKSYSLDLPATDKNKSLVKYSNEVSSVVSGVGVGRIVVDELEVIKGKLTVMSVSELVIKIIISGYDFANTLDTIIIDAIWTSGDDHTLNSTNLVASWTAAEGSLYRYPLLDFGELYKIYGNYVCDFVPIWSVYNIIQRIFTTAKINIDTNSWLNSSACKELYVLCPFKAANESFLIGKGLEVRVTNAADNRASISHVGGTSNIVTLSKAFIDFDTKTLDEGSDWDTTNDRYNIPENGVYKFEIPVAINCTHDTDVRFTSVDRTYAVYVKYYNGSTTVTLDEFSESLTGVGAWKFDGALIRTVETGYHYLTTAGYVYIEMYLESQATNSGATLTVYINTKEATANMAVKTVFTKRSLQPAVGSTLNPEDYLPKISALDFLKGLKEAYGLLFWYDKSNNKMYCNTFNDFIGTTVIDWSEKQSYSDSVEMEIIASGKEKYATLKWKADTSDKVYTEYVSKYGVPYTKDITLTNEFTENKRVEKSNDIFAATAKRTYLSGNNLNIAIPAIYGSQEYTKGNGSYPEFRATAWEMRLLKWFGDVSPAGSETISWSYFDSWNDTSPTAKNTYPKAETPSMTDNFVGFTKAYRMIDYSKKFEVVIIISQPDYIKFITVLNTAASEGFRALYKVFVNGQYALCYIAGMVYNGSKAKITFIQKI